MQWDMVVGSPWQEQGHNGRLAWARSHAHGRDPGRFSEFQKHGQCSCASSTWPPPKHLVGNMLIHDQIHDLPSVILFSCQARPLLSQLSALGSSAPSLTLFTPRPSCTQSALMCKSIDEAILQFNPCSSLRTAATWPTTPAILAWTFVTAPNW